MLTWLRYHKGFKLGKEARNMIRDTYMEAQKEIENKKFERACLSGDDFSEIFQK